MLKNRKNCLDIVFPSTSVYFFVLPGAARCALASHHMTRRAVLPNSNTVTGALGRVYGKHPFRCFGVETAEMLQINLFGPMLFFAVQIYLSLSIRVVKSKIEFAAAENRRTMGVIHVTTNFEKIDFLLVLKNQNLLRHNVS